MRTALIVLLLVIIGGLQYRLWFGRGSMAEVQHLEQKITAQQVTNQRLKERNQRMMAEIRDLREGEEALEERARQDLGLIKDGEVFYRLVE